VDGSPTTMMLSVPFFTATPKLRHVTVSLPRIDALRDDYDTRYCVPFEPKALPIPALRGAAHHHQSREGHDAPAPFFLLTVEGGRTWLPTQSSHIVGGSFINQRRETG
jgi:hypothetical protein